MVLVSKVVILSRNLIKAGYTQGPQGNRKDKKKDIKMKDWGREFLTMQFYGILSRNRQGFVVYNFQLESVSVFSEHDI